MGRWIKLFDKFLEWEWFPDATVVQMFIYLLLKANYEDKRCCGRLIRRGQLLTSTRHLAEILEIAPNTVVRALKALENSGCIRKETDRKKGTLITIVKYNDYQIVDNSSVSNNDTPTDTLTDTPTDTLTDTNIRNKEYKNIEREYAREENFSFTEKLKSETSWTEPMAMNYHLPIETVCKMIDEAATAFRLDNDEPRDYSTFRQRCRQYINAHYKRFTQNKLKPNNYGNTQSCARQIGSDNPDDYRVEWAKY